MSPEEKDQKIERLEKENQALRERIAELERGLGLDSKTSSKPPTSDGLKKSSKIRTKSLRERGKRPSGGQIGHPGQTLEQVLQPDNIVEHPTRCSCPGCGCDISVVIAKKIIKRQVFDIPDPGIIVTEHRVAVKECPECKTLLQGSFPKSVIAPVQYGARIRAVAAYLHHQHFIPEDRLSEVLDDLFSCRMTPGTIAKTTLTLAKIIEPVVDEIAGAVKTSPVKHLDETGFRIGGKTNWLHVVSTETQTWYRVSPKRKDIEVLADIKGVVVHDHWNPYYQLLDVNHALCNAHHLRELKALEEIEQESWAKSMKKLLLLACNYQHRYQSGIPKNILPRLNQLYEQILQRGLSFHHSQPPLTRQGNRGRVKRRVGHNLLLRLHNFRGDVLRFLTEPDVPFTNNQAERDLRMMKCKQKISGGFRSFDFAVSFANIRSFLSTASKHGLNLLEVITDALEGDVSVFLSSITTS
ncbi:IS66 family transposase [Nostoc sp. UHCC 0251]|uniref:IS66 family transposase n=1 Tax=Nostoc sp. UHCC 0251 TaxID=3110240 RepID=UPI002B1ED17D|nr:IS66 family transposase [Nostoc sp. UHCC 0251]MEA5624845.1 IS66 family transposase [Nostoc sp. UHCC 0251]